MPLAAAQGDAVSATGLAGRVLRFLAAGPFGLRRCAVCASPCAGADGTPPVTSPDESASAAGLALRLGLCPDCATGLAACVRPCCPLCGREPLAPHARGLSAAGQGGADGGVPARDRAAVNAVCAACAEAVPAWDGLIFFGLHDGLLRDLVLGLKYAARLDRTALLSSMLVLAVRRLGIAPDPGSTVVVPMPLWRGRLAGRGFNQSLELARPLARVFGLPLAPQGLARVRRTVQQARLSFEERQENLEGAFAAGGSVAGRRVWLVDDVLTSGATARSACAALREAGALRVDVIVAARTPKEA